MQRDLRFLQGVSTNLMVALGVLVTISDGISLAYLAARVVDSLDAALVGGVFFVFGWTLTFDRPKRVSQQIAYEVLLNLALLQIAFSGLARSNTNTGPDFINLLVSSPWHRKLQFALVWAVGRMLVWIVKQAVKKKLNFELEQEK